jgi:hypothetical protein
VRLGPVNFIPAVGRGGHVLEILEGRRPGGIYDDLLDMEEIHIRTKNKL